jgi:hypothetical protein
MLAHHVGRVAFHTFVMRKPNNVGNEIGLDSKIALLKVSSQLVNGRFKIHKFAGQIQDKDVSLVIVVEILVAMWKDNLIHDLEDVVDKDVSKHRRC